MSSFDNNNDFNAQNDQFNATTTGSDGFGQNQYSSGGNSGFGGQDNFDATNTGTNMSGGGMGMGGGGINDTGIGGGVGGGRMNDSGMGSGGMGTGMGGSGGMNDTSYGTGTGTDNLPSGNTGYGSGAMQNDDGDFSGNHTGGKPSMGDKLKGGAEKLAGKVLGKPGLQERGQEREMGDFDNNKF